MVVAGEGAWAAVLLALGLPGVFALVFGTRSVLARAMLVVPGILLLLRYLAWRWGAPFPEGGAAQAAWAWLFLVLETATSASGLLILFFLLRGSDRAAEARAPTPRALADAPVDVFICTYNEGRDILERTILCARHIQHPDLRVWVLDDGARDWVEAMARDLGVRYLCRRNGKHAKAGNINNGLAHALASDRPPEFILLLDADFAAHRGILRRTLPLFAAADVGIVQTPQHFYNPDPVQAGLLAARWMPDEQRFFFNHLLAGKDGWGAAFCCGTSAVIRVRALVEAGGMATETVTEDMLTSFKIAEYGWRTVFLNERLSAGLAPEGIAEYVGQRARWCLGGVQQVHTRWSFWGRARLPWVQRLSQFDTLLYWAGSFPSRLAVLAAPALFWWFGLRPFDATVEELLGFLLPAVIWQILALGLVSRWSQAPILSDVTQLLITVPVMVAVVQGLLRPWGRPFKVTPKGLSRTETVVHWGLLAPFAVLALATAGGLLWNLSAWSEARDAPGYSLAVLWTLVVVLVLGIVIACCVEPPRPRQEERFTADEPARLVWEGAALSGRLGDLSTRGAFLRAEAPPPPGTRATLWLDGGTLRLPCTVKREARGGVGLMFDADDALRRALILRLYTGDYVNETEEMALGAALWAGVRRVVG